MTSDLRAGPNAGTVLTVVQWTKTGERFWNDAGSGSPPCSAGAGVRCGQTYGAAFRIGRK